MLEHHRLTGFRRRNQQAALAFADGRNQVDQAAGNVFLCLDVAFQVQTLGREQRGQVLEQDLVLGLLGRTAIDLVYLHQRKIALTFFGRADLAFDGIASVQIETSNLRRANVNVIRACQIG